MKTIADVAPETVRWLWKGWIPLGKVTMLDGDPGDGKSLITLDIAARVSTGRAMPDKSPSISGGAVFVCAEDGVPDTLRPRLDALGADCSRITELGLSLRDEETFQITPEYIAKLEAAIEAMRGVLVVLDPGPSFLPKGVDPSIDPEVRRVLILLVRLAERTGTAIVIIRHLNKDEQKKTIYRGSGSIAWIGLSRSGLMVANDPDDEQSHVLFVYKANLAKKPKGLKYRIADRNDVPVMPQQRAS